MASLPPRAVVVSRPSEYATVLAGAGSRAHARFVLASRGESLEALEDGHRALAAAFEAALKAIPLDWRRAVVDRSDLDRFLFGPEDVVVCVGQDGLVANTAKYLDGQLVIGVNPGAYDGVLVRHPAEVLVRLLPATRAGEVFVEERTMVEASAGGETLLALNEVYFGHERHQSARYRLSHGGQTAPHSSSGVVVATGTGATGWARSICRERRAAPELPSPEKRSLVFLVREAFPSITTDVELTAGCIEEEEALILSSEMSEGLVVFGDGIEADRLRLGFGEDLTVRVAPRVLRLVSGR